LTCLGGYKKYFYHFLCESDLLKFGIELRDFELL